MKDMQSIVNEVADSMNVSSLPVKEKDDGNLATDGEYIFFNPMFVNRLMAGGANEGGLRFAFAHELGHVANGMAGGHTGELAADEFATRSVVSLGLGWESISGVMSNLKPDASETHPSALSRVNRARSNYFSQNETKQRRQRTLERKRRMHRLSLLQDRRRDRNRNTKDLAI